MKKNNIFMAVVLTALVAFSSCGTKPGLPTLKSNNDSLNDEWNVHHVFVKDFSLKIYNRWGQLIFQSTDKNVQWKGESMSGTIEQSDVYIYLINYTGWDDSFHVAKGNLTLLR